MNQFELKNLIFEDVTRVITEELGIANDVKNMTDTIYDKIINDSKNVSKEIIDDRISCKNNYFTMDDIFGNKLTIFYYIYNFKDNVYRKAYIARNGNDYLSSLSRHVYRNIRNVRKLVVNSITISIECLSGTVQDIPKIKDSIQHELEHIYQQSMMKKEFGNADMYSIIVSNLGNSNIYERYIANLLYMSFKSEIEAYANGLYAFVKNLDYDVIDKLNIAFKQSDAYHKLEELYQIRSFLKEHYDSLDFNKAIMAYGRFGMNKNKILKVADDTIKEMTRRFGRALLKAKRDRITMGGYQGIIERFIFNTF